MKLIKNIRDAKPRLKINRETLRVLGTAELVRAVGGRADSSRIARDAETAAEIC